MAKNSGATITDKNLDRLMAFLINELEHPALATQIPDGAHIFHGAYNDLALTQANLNMAMTVLLGMVLGLREEAPLVLLFEHKPGQYTVVNLSTEERKRQVRAFAETFQAQNRQEILTQINELLAA